MAVHGFAEKQVAEKLRDFANRKLAPHPGPVQFRTNHGVMCLTPSGGIPKFTGSGSVPSAQCAIYAIDENGNWANTSESILVYNIFQTAIGGDTVITAKFNGSHWIVDAEDCPPGDPPLSWGGNL